MAIIVCACGLALAMQETSMLEQPCIIDVDRSEIEWIDIPDTPEMRHMTYVDDTPRSTSNASMYSIFIPPPLTNLRNLLESRCVVKNLPKSCFLDFHKLMIAFHYSQEVNSPQKCGAGIESVNVDIHFLQLMMLKESLNLVEISSRKIRDRRWFTLCIDKHPSVEEIENAVTLMNEVSERFMIQEGTVNLDALSSFLQESRRRSGKDLVFRFLDKYI